MAQWPRWRGPLDTGEAPMADPPVRWSSDQNIAWKTKLPGHGLGSPVVWGDRLILTTAIPFGPMLEPRYSGAPGAHNNVPVRQKHRFAALAVDRKTGKILWQTTLRESLPHAGGHETASLASASAVTNGKQVIAFFGSHGLHGLDMEGHVLWQKNLGRMNIKHAHGEGASPTLHGQTVVVNWDHEDDSFIAAFDVVSGEARWKKERDEITSWSTPIVVEVAGAAQVIVAGSNRVRGYDLQTGREIWACGGMSNNIVASPVHAEGMVYFGSSYGRQTMLAIRLAGAKGEITDTAHVAWRRMRRTPYVPSPLLYRDKLGFFSHYQPVWHRLTAKTGEETDRPVRLPHLVSIYASPVAAAGRIYITDMDGTTLVMKPGPEPEILSVNRLNEPVSASAALVGRHLYLRGAQHLYGIVELEKHP